MGYCMQDRETGEGWSLEESRGGSVLLEQRVQGQQGAIGGSEARR